jgi:NAD(P)H dehydrogenase (quinone)
MQGSRFIEISGPTYYSSNDVAVALGEALGRPITAIAVPRETWVETVAQHGIPADLSGAYIEMFDSFNSGWTNFGVPNTEHIKGTTDLLTAVKSLVSKST